MATTYTDNLNLQQPDFDDDALITVINNDMEIIDKAINGVQDGLAIVANGNTHVAISAGQFVYVRNHTTLTEGLYVASSNIAANATLSTSNLTADSAGGLNALNGKIAPSIIGATSLADFETKINAMLSSMIDGQTKDIIYAPNAAFSPFKAYNYVGELKRVTATAAVCELTRNGWIVYGYYSNSTWTWESISDDLTPIYHATKTITFTSGKGTVLFASGVNLLSVKSVANGTYVTGFVRSNGYIGYSIYISSSTTQDVLIEFYYTKKTIDEGDPFT